MDSGYNRAVCTWHRRAGKDLTLLNLMAKKMLERVGQYFYLTPTYAQGKKIIWNGMSKEGFKFLDHIPQEIRRRTDSSDMLIELKNGSIFQIIGTDNYDSIMGTNPVGCVFSEYSLQNPLAWEYIKPILEENGGWAVFNFTPRGENHAYDMMEMAKSNPEWFSQILTIDDTGVISREQFNKLLAEGMDDDLAAQEFYCSFAASLKGAYYANQMKKATQEGRITEFAYESTLPVFTFWDLGMGDSTAIWFMQRVGEEYRFFDYYENNGEPLQHYIQVLQNKGYIYDSHYAPHDIEVRELGTGVTRWETAQKLGITFKIVPRTPSLDDGIQSVRSIFHRCWFHETGCRQGLNALKSYTKKWNDKMQVYSSTPEHNWASHGADAFRMFAQIQPRLSVYTERDATQRLEYFQETTKKTKNRFI